MEKKLKFHAVFEKHGKWYVGYVPEVPGVNAQERTLKAARESLVIALRELAEIDPQAVFGINRRTEEIEVTLEGKAA
ncbi:MAG: type II toxin-antitoxin system HicB family antitoxin [Chloroflexi bacterium]|nr:type II toxin-antitoxin system HicB family antitoxin [Chloroflexota bacterium]